MRGGSEIIGNLFSNGTAFGSGTITDIVVVAQNGNTIDGLSVGKDARVYTCKDGTISGDLTYHISGSNTCIVLGNTDTTFEEISPVDFSITPSMIADWKADAQAGGVIVGDTTIDTDTILGPVKIEGDLLVKGAILTITGTIWVTGTFDTGTNVEVRLDGSSYGDLSGVLMTDGNIKIRNNAVLEGTSSPSSYLLVMSNSSSLSESSAAIEVKNNALGSILFAPNGLITIDNNVELIEATSYQILLKNNATVTYEIGLENLEFTSGPSGSWEMTSWKEVE